MELVNKGARKTDGSPVAAEAAGKPDSAAADIGSGAAAELFAAEDVAAAPRSVVVGIAFVFQFAPVGNIAAPAEGSAAQAAAFDEPAAA